MCIEMHSHNRRCRSKTSANGASRLSFLIPLLFSIVLFKLFLSVHVAPSRASSLSLSLFLSASLCTFVFLRVSLPAFPRFLSIHTKPRCKRLIGLRPPRDANDRIPFPRFGPVDAVHLVARSSNENRITRHGVYDRKIVFRLSNSQPDCSERTCPITLLRSNFPLKEFLTVI